jgi:hypothetical protein
MYFRECFKRERKHRLSVSFQDSCRFERVARLLRTVRQRSRPKFEKATRSKIPNGSGQSRAGGLPLWQRQFQEIVLTTLGSHNAHGADESLPQRNRAVIYFCDRHHVCM